MNKGMVGISNEGRNMLGFDKAGKITASAALPRE